ncbi:MAG: hypothetical protein HYX84_06170 [Chloroflexi bacterium]|nr:hypothetical protein [Chloroflexota bacterium]
MSRQPELPPELDIFGPLVKCSALVAAGRLGLFRALAAGPRSVPEIADELGASEDGIARLGEALAALGYLEVVNGRYANGVAPRAWYRGASRADYTPFLEFIGDAWGIFGKLADTVRRGRPEPDMRRFIEEHPETARRFFRYMKANAQLRAGPIADLVPLPHGARRLLDLGGSHGLYSIAYCRRNPDLRATVFDLPAALCQTEADIAAEGLSARISVQQGDYLEDDIGRGYDAVLCPGMIESNSCEENRRLFRAISGALDPGGMVLVLSHAKLEPFDPANAVFSLVMFAAYGTRTYTWGEITGWLEEACFVDCRRIECPGGVTMITATTSGQGTERIGQMEYPYCPKG